MNIRHCTVAAAVAAALGTSTAAFAQTPEIEEEPMDEVVVSGIRYGIESSIAVKRDSDSIVESITAEDIGKLPDTSIAESIARLPGLAAQRVNGRAQVISIRGLGPRYGATLLNGREMVSTGDNRSVELDQFPSELINSATVYKTPDATLVGQGLSGTLNMQTIRPLNYDDRQIVLNGRLDKNSNGSLNADSDDRGGRYSASYVDQFADGKFGLALGLAYLDAPNQERHYKSWWWADTSVWGAPLPGIPEGTIALQGFEAGAASTEQKRTGAMAVLEFKPTENVRSTVDLYFSKFDQREIRRTLMSGMDTWGGASYSDFTTTSHEGDDIVTGGTIEGLRPVALTTMNNRDDEVMAAGWNTELRMGDWTAVADFSYSKAERDETNAELQAGVIGTVTLTDLDIAIGPGRTTLTPSADFSDPNSVLLSDPAGWGRDGRSQFPRVEDQLKSARFSVSREFENIFSFLEVGANYSDRTKDMNRTEVYYNLKNGRTPVVLPQDSLIRSTSLAFGGIPGSLISFDFPSVLATYYDVDAAALNEAPGRIWDVAEKVTTGYVKLGFDVDTPYRVHGNLGLQVVRADQSSNGQVWDDSRQESVAITGGKKYTDLLPSFNFIVDFPKDTYLRLGIARTLARPNTEDMRAGFSGIGIGTTPPYEWSASGGNPTLEPWRANAYDISIEKYFGKRSYVSAAYFYKDLKNFVYTQQIDYDFTGFPVPDGTVNLPQSNIGTLSAPANGHSGLIAGVELSVSVDFGMFHDALEGFGVQFNGSDTRSSLHEDNDQTKPLDGLSGRVTNVTAYYENHGFSARIAQRHRSRFVTTVRGTFGENVPSAINAESIVDAQLGYAFQGRMDGLSLLLQVNNLTDEPYETEVGIAAGSVNPTGTLPERYTTYGREYLFGFNWRL
jgi:iron complex outermembrane receptor protein